MSHYNRICRLFIQAHAALFFILLVYIKVPDLEDLKLRVPRSRLPQWHWAIALCCQPHAVVLMLFTSFSQKQSLDSVCWKAPVLSRPSKVWSEPNYDIVPIALIITKRYITIAPKVRSCTRPTKQRHLCLSLASGPDQIFKMLFA